MNCVPVQERRLMACLACHAAAQVLTRKQYMACMNARLSPCIRRPATPPF